ncbi:tRNA glutamyl-Q(34) synthetase GluQRS [Hyphobacterium sp. HN65]|uniref:tRNA glutamyl-Q(34) synthetase GluQRS n=1 Tax=Hyphobacterium lacteum TaxID=3116575 RepID=A0ABU7LQ40_9PROT|nr:tRNA glutamyl-Q(34) synthetase GluQRS [Hyphobacterium sp. HN65]MEE2526017.1 tRNA glutamyl-Q(34) synthetase GluQRS [Hyphobacterium sp. HN65]
MSEFVTRFAPSPTGYLHKGHAFSALSAFDAARAADGRFLLRIEDIDTTRCKPEFEQAIHGDLAWLGLKWEAPVRRQSEHFPEYHAAIDQLAARGLVYRCFKTRKEILEDIARAPHHPGEGPDGAIYPRPAEPMSADEETERLDAGEAFAWRLSLRAVEAELGDLSRLTFIEEGHGPNGETGEIAIRADLIGDVIIGRKDVGTSYHLAVTMDDALQGISHVIRGEDLFFATSVHRILQSLLGLPVPVYRHHALLTGPDGKRLAKRDRSLTLKSIRDSGISARELRLQLGFNW